MGPTEITTKSTHDQFMRVVYKELEAFEKRELKFQAEQRKERAAELKLPQRMRPRKTRPTDCYKSVKTKR